MSEEFSETFDSDSDPEIEDLDDSYEELDDDWDGDDIEEDEEYDERFDPPPNYVREEQAGYGPNEII